MLAEVSRSSLTWTGHVVGDNKRIRNSVVGCRGSNELMDEWFHPCQCLHVVFGSIISRMHTLSAVRRRCVLQHAVGIQAAGALIMLPPTVCRPNAVLTVLLDLRSGRTC